MPTLPLAVLALLAQSAPVSDLPRFMEVHRFPAPVDGAVGDVDGDGDLDIVRERVHLNDGRGLFELGPPIPAVFYAGAPVELVDVDVDGDLDLLVLNGSLHTLYNDGHGNFHDLGAATLVLGGTQARADLITGDLDGDRAPEVFVAMGSTHDDDFFTGAVFDGGYALLTNDGSGRFTLASERLPPPAYKDAGSASIVDLDLDYYHVGLAYHWTPGQLQPFVVGSIGATRFAPESSIFGDETRFSASVGGGLAAYFTSNVGIKVEGRLFSTLIDSSEDAFCDRFNCYRYDDSQYLVQGELRAGLVFAF